MRYVEDLQGTETGDRTPRRLREVTAPQTERSQRVSLRDKTVVVQRQSGSVQSEFLERRETQEGVRDDVDELIVSDVENSQRRRRDVPKNANSRESENSPKI